MTSEMKTLRARFIATMDGPILRDSCATIADGRIVAIGGSSSGSVEDLGDAILLPGLVNAHAHLELTRSTCGIGAGASFAEWLSSVRPKTPPTSDDVIAAMRDGFAQCLRYGVTCVGDIAQNTRASRSAASGNVSRPRLISYGEVLGLAKRRYRFDELLAMAIEAPSSSDVILGISPHAPYTVDRPGYETCLRIARERRLPLATHLAETEHERTFLESHGGPFRELWDRLGAWADPVETFRGAPIEFADAIGLLEYPTLLAHVNYCDDRELAMLARGNASVVYCPRTHRYFDHPPHRWREMLAAGINVTIGTDSCASSPNLNLVDDLRLLREIASDVSPVSLWEMATIRAARAVRMDDQVGSIAVGKRADLVAFTVHTSDPLREVLESRDKTPAHVWIDGNRIY